MNILLTGASGFIGQRVVHVIQQHDQYTLTCAFRRPIESLEVAVVQVDGLEADTDWSAALAGQGVVIHVAARAHIMKDEVADPLAEYRKVNADGTLNLARQAAAAGVKRFIFISTIKVNGEQTSLDQPFTAEDTPAPEDDYGLSKWEAEEGLRLLAEETGLEVVIIRPPLVYGPGVKANFLSLLKLSATGLPLPFGSMYNKRSMVYVGNLVDLIVRCIHHPSAANETFLVSDGDDVSLRSLLTMLRSAMGRSPRLVPVPVGLFKLAGALTGKRGVVDRLVGDLQVDSSKAPSVLGWVPPYTVEQGIATTVADFMNNDK